MVCEILLELREQTFQMGSTLGWMDLNPKVYCLGYDVVGFLKFHRVHNGLGDFLFKNLDFQLVCLLDFCRVGRSGSI